MFDYNSRIMFFILEILVFSLLLIFVVIVGILVFFRNIVDKIKFRKKAKPLILKVEEAKKELNTILEPNYRATLIDTDAYKERYHDLFVEVSELISQTVEFRPHEVLEMDILEDFQNLFLFEIDNKLLAENNRIYDSIQALKNNTVEAKKKYTDFFSESHYVSYSEFETLKKSIEVIDTLAKTVLPKYSQYVDDDVKEFIRRKGEVENDRVSHNRDFVIRELADCKNYFDTVLGTYPLDPQQRDSIVKLEDNCLVIASAGSGKTSTILGKAKYLVEKRNIAPSKILLITYTKKAATELQERMKIEGITCCTFHKLAKDIIAQVTGQAPSFCDADVPLIIFHKLIETNKDFLHAINNYIINQQSLMGLEHDYEDAFSYFEDRKKYGIQALFPDVDGKIIFTRSEEEKRLVSILTKLGVPFRYENGYQVNTRTPERRQYKPDFTIYYQDGSEQWKWLYLEHFAINSVGNVPLWFGEGTRGGWSNANRRYQEGIEWKRATHRQYGTILIETTSADFRDGTVESKLKQQLQKYGVPIKERTDEELYELLVKRSKKIEKSVYTLILSFITLMKANEKSIRKMVNELESWHFEDDYAAPPTSVDKRNLAILTDIIKPFYDEYQRVLDQRYEIDFTDAIIQATELCRKGLWKQYEYILVDEFQDISVDRYKFLQALRSDSPKTKLYCVGDDWQSIFRFAGSDMSLVYEFEKYFGYTEQCKIETTYRFHQPLIDKSSAFIMRNKEQKEKTIKTPSNDTYKTYLNFVKCDGEDKDGVKKEVETIVASIPNDQSILLLGRYNYDAMSVGFNGKIDMKDNRIMVKIGKRELPFLSVHSAKGLEADHVILVNCNQGAYGFPSLIEDDPILDFVLSKSETYPFAEERRLFYVAMTRARMRMYVLYDQKRPSPFISEFLLKVEVGSYLCPRCLEGKMVAIKDGITANGEQYRSFVCSNNEGGCDFYETKYGDLTPPGIQITEQMTAQDVEKLREARRSSRGHRLPNVSLTPHSPIGEFYPMNAMPQEYIPNSFENETQEGCRDDLPF